jgi:aminoglycoside phosphotransferase (APT) family kinase protein
MSTGDIATRLATQLRALWQLRLGETPQIENLRALSAGASAQTFSFEVAAQRYIAQLFGGGEQFPGALDKPEQARMQQLAGAAGVPTPEVMLSWDTQADLVAGFVSRFVEGETLGKRIVADPRLAGAREQLPLQCADALARIHGLDAAQFAWLPLRSAENQIAELAQIHRRFGEALPVFELALAWLSAHRPAEPEACVVHGDFRNGNLLVNEQGLAGVLDWELAHRGDPHEDLGWLCMRSWRFGRDDLAAGGFAKRADFYAAYEKTSGLKVNAGAVRFWETLGALKWGVICQWFAQRRLQGTVQGLEPAVIGRRVSEVELQLLDLIEGRGE